MKLFALLLNVAAFLFVCTMLFIEDFPLNLSDRFIVGGVFLFPLINIYAIKSSNDPQFSSVVQDNFVLLYFKRRTLEEKMKIAALQQVGSNER